MSGLSRNGASLHVAVSPLMDRGQESNSNQPRNYTASGTWLLASGGSRDAGGVVRDSAVHNVQPTATRTYNGIAANDNSRFHAGDVYNYNYHMVPTNVNHAIPKAEGAEKILEKLRFALRFPQMGLRYAIVEEAYSDTCQWLFSTPEYRDWQDSSLYSCHRGFLWIKGKPGSGKSTIMKTLLSRTESLDSSLPNEKVLSYFFNARGDILERTTEGLYRSLLYQALENIPILPLEVTRGLNPESLELFHREGWQVDLLKNLLRKVVLLDLKVRFSCFIDALDEGDSENSVRNMVDFLESLSETAHQRGLRLSICLASRHYPNISLHRLQELNLDDHVGHMKDIDTYVRSKTMMSGTVVAEDLVASIKARSSGVFLWVVLVIAELKKHADHGESHKLRSLLDSIPDGVERLLDDILQRTGVDGRFTITLQWALYSLRPLNPVEFHTAVRLGNGEISNALETWNGDFDESGIRNFILSASRGLLEVVSRTTKRVQFIHESVREYFLRGGLLKVDRALQESCHGISHLRLTRWCREYLEMVNFVDLANRLRRSQDAYEHWRYMLGKFPLLKYAMDGVLEHAEEAACHGLDALPFDRDFQLYDWVTLKSGFGETADDLSPYNKGTSSTLIHVLLYEGHENLLDVELSRYPENLPYNFWAHLDSSGQFSDTDGENRAIGRTAARCRAGDQTGKTWCMGSALHMAVSHGMIDFAHALIRRGADVNDFCHVRGSPLFAAYARDPNGSEVVDMLLERHASERAPSTCARHYPQVCECGQLLLRDAVFKRNLRRVEAKLKNSADPNKRDAGKPHAVIHSPQTL